MYVPSSHVIIAMYGLSDGNIIYLYGIVYARVICRDIYANRQTQLTDAGAPKEYLFWEPLCERGIKGKYWYICENLIVYVNANCGI